MKDLIFGKIQTYLILTDAMEYTIGGRSYIYKKGILTVRDGFKKVATFNNIKNIIQK